MFIERSGCWQALDTLALFGGIEIVIVVEVFQDVAWFAFEDFADGVERGEANGLDLAGLYARHVHVGDADFIRKVVERHLAISHDSVKLKDDSHCGNLKRFVSKFLKKDAVFKYERKGECNCSSKDGS